MTTSELPREAALAFASHGDWARAVPALRAALAHDPEDAHAQALLALGLANLEQPREAVAAGRRAVALDPESSFGHYALGWALLEDDDISGGEASAREALRLDPDADGFALLGQALGRRARWNDVLEAVEQGLQLDPEHAGLQNLRGLALASLGRTDEAASTIGKALAADPDDAVTHMNRGWLLLRQSKPDEALESFRTSLRLDPTIDAARMGIVESLKARNGLYRLLLRGVFWLTRLDSRTRLWLFIGLFVGVRVARSAMRANPELEPILVPLVLLYGAFVVATWLMEPFSNLLLRLNPYGRLALSKSERLAANVVGGCLATTVIAVGISFATGGAPGWGTLAAVSLFLLIPASGAVRASETRRGRPLLILVVILAVLAATAVVLAFLGSEAALPFLFAVLLGAVLFTWVAAFLRAKYG